MLIFRSAAPDALACSICCDAFGEGGVCFGGDVCDVSSEGNFNIDGDVCGRNSEED